MKTVKKISLITIILTSIITLVSCSSGGTGSQGQGLDLSGRWSGAVTTRSGFIPAEMSLSQERVVSVGDEIIDINGIVSIVSEIGTQCSYSFSFDNAELNTRTNSLSAGAGDDVTLIAQVSNREIIGTFNFFGDSGGEQDACQVISGGTRFTRL